MCEAARENRTENQPELAALSPDMPKFSMKWHRFLTKGYLWIAAAYHLFQAIWILGGKIYYEPSAKDALYADMPAMHMLDTRFAVLLIAGALLLILSCVHLARKKKSGIALLKGAYILLSLSFIAYPVVRLLISGMPPLNFPCIGQAVSALTLLFVNRSYYRKRSCLFHA